MVATMPWRLLAVIVATATAVAVEFRFTILHTNDMHAHYDETCRDPAAAVNGSCGVSGGYGGFARLRAALDAERARADADGAPAVYLYAGDTFSGTQFYDAFGWEPAADFLGDLGVDAMCLGNHEFETGTKELALFLRSKNLSSIPIVVANINTEEEPSLINIHPSTVLKVNGHSIGVIGYLTPDTMFVNEVGKVKITDEVQSIKTEVAKLKKSGVEFIIALGHSGLEMDETIAREVDGIDVVVGGHSHTYIFSGPPQDTEIPIQPYPIIVKRGEQIVPVVQAYAFTKYLGKLVLTFNNEKRLIKAIGEPILLDHTIPQDTKVLEKVKYYKKLLEKQTKTFIGTTKVFLDGNCNCKESNLANLITDSFVRFNLINLLNNNVTLADWTDAAVAITVSGGIKSSINASLTQGKVYNDDIKRVLPYKSYLYKVNITGKTLLKSLEHSASMYDYTNCSNPEKKIYGGFMQMSGMRVIYNMTNAVGSRVQSVTIRCTKCRTPLYEPIILDKQYTVIMSKFLVYGGDEYNMIKEGIIDMMNLNITEMEAFQMYLKEMSPVYAEVDNRIKILNNKFNTKKD